MRYRISILAALFGALWFGGLAAAGLPGSGWIAAVDARLGAWITGLRSPEGLALFRLVTALGNKETIIALAVLVSLLLWRRGRGQVAALWLVPIGASATTAWLKTAFARPRPDFALQNLPDFSFPSGHATGAMAFYGFLAWLMVQGGWLRPGPGLALGALVIGLIGFSRLYLGVHYLSDVLNGYLVGALWALAGAHFLRESRENSGN